MVAIKNVTAAEEYLRDHFPGFPVLPGVFMIEGMVQAARHMLEHRGMNRMVLGEVKGVKYGSFVRPGEALRIEVLFEKELESGVFAVKGTGVVLKHGGNEQETAVTGRFTMRAVRMEVPAVVAGA